MERLEKLCAARDQMLLSTDITEEMKVILSVAIERDITEESQKIFAANHR